MSRQRDTSHEEIPDLFSTAQVKAHGWPTRTELAGAALCLAVLLITLTVLWPHIAPALLGYVRAMFGMAQFIATIIVALLLSAAIVGAVVGRSRD